MIGVSQKIAGKGNIQAGRDVIMNVISGVTSFQDIDQAISDLHDHLEGLQWQRGKKDIRVILAVAFGLAVYFGIKVWTTWSILLFVSAIALVFIGNATSKIVARIDLEISAANLLLVELYRQKICYQISRKN